MHQEDSIEIDVELTAPQDLLDLQRSTVALRVAQEALRNVHKHAAATQVRVLTCLEPASEGGTELWILEVVDNGHGFAVDEVLEHTSKRNFGVRFMRERAQLIGARLEIDLDAGGWHDRPPGSSHGEELREMAIGYRSGPPSRGTDRRSPDAKVRIVLVDDHALFRLGMRRDPGAEAGLRYLAEAEDPRRRIRRGRAAFARHRPPRSVDRGARAASRRPSGSSARSRDRNHHARRRGGRGPAVRGDQGRRGRIHPQGHPTRGPRHDHPPCQQRRVPHQQQGLRSTLRGKPGAEGVPRARDVRRRKQPPSSRPSRLARSRSSTTSPRA